MWQSKDLGNSESSQSGSKHNVNSTAGTKSPALNKTMPCIEGQTLGIPRRAPVHHGSGACCPPAEGCPLVLCSWDHGAPVPSLTPTLDVGQQMLQKVQCRVYGDCSPPLSLHCNRHEMGDGHVGPKGCLRLPATRCWGRGLWLSKGCRRWKPLGWARGGESGEQQRTTGAKPPC